MPVRDSTGVIMNNATQTFTTPAVVDGDRLLLISAGRASVTVVTPPAGFEERYNNTTGSSTASNVRLVVYEKTVADGETEPATHAVVWSNNPFSDAIAVSVSDVDVDTQLVVDVIMDLGSDALVVTPSVEVVAENTIIIGGAAMNISSATPSFAATASGDFIELEDPGQLAGTTRVAAAIGTVEVDAGGEYPPINWAVTSAALGAALGFVLVYMPEGAAAPPPPGPNPVVGTTLGDTFMSWRLLNGLEAWEDYVGAVMALSGLHGHVADAQHEFFKDQAIDGGI